MDLKRIWRKGLLALMVIFVSGRVSSDANSINLVANGSFEDPLIPSSSQCGPFMHCLGFHNAVPGSDNIGGWQLIGTGGVDDDGNPIPGARATIILLGFDYTEPDTATGGTLYFHPQDGLQSVDLTGEGNQGSNGIKQSVTTDPGRAYLLSFWLGHQFSLAPGYLEGPAALELNIDGQNVGSFTNSDDTFEEVSWTRFRYRFTASSSQTVIAFLNDTPVGNNYSGLDNVSLLAVPEPASVVLVGVGAAGLAWLRRRGRRKVSSL